MCVPMFAAMSSCGSSKGSWLNVCKQEVCVRLREMQVERGSCASACTSYGSTYVNTAFATRHAAHASTVLHVQCMLSAYQRAV